jgi:hypothetical protein
MFYAKAVLNKIATKETGKQQYMRVDYIQIRQPGEQLHVVDRPAHDGDKMRFAQAWDRYQKRRDSGPVGTPLEALFPFHPEIVLTCRSNGAPSVEALADMSDTAISTFPFGGSELRAKARSYLMATGNPEGVKHVQEMAAFDAMKSENAALKGELDTQRTLVANLEGRLAALESRGALPGRHEPGPGDVAAGEALEAARRAPGRPRRDA